MNNEDFWKPTKYVKQKNNWAPSNNPSEVSRGSRFIAKIQITIYSSLIERYASGILLDLGCGKVPLYGIYNSLVDNIICLDWEDSMHQNDYLDYSADLNTNIPLADSSCNTILATDLFEHIQEPNSLFAECRRVLATDGTCILTVPFLYWLHETPHDYFRYTRFALVRYCEINNLKIIELEPYGGPVEVILDILNKIFGRHKFSSFLILNLSNVLVKIYSLILKKSTKSSLSERFPLGYYLVFKKK
jgi:SAM-dependent methyltransferase